MIEIKSSAQTIQIIGNIRGIKDINNIKQATADMQLSPENKLNMEIINSFAMPSAMIGYLMKVVQQDKIELTLKVGDDRLIELLNDLGLKDLFNIKQLNIAFA